MIAIVPPPSPPEGLIIDLVTPLTPAGRLDGEGLKTLLARVTPEADGILAASPGVGEAMNLSWEVRRELFTQLLIAVGGRCPLIFGITGHSWEETRELGHMCQDECLSRNYPGPVFLADLPLWYHSNRGLPQAYQNLFAEVSLPVVLLNLPEVVQGRGPMLKHRNLRTQVFKKLALLSGVVGLIYQGEMRRFLNYHYAAASRPGFAFYEADETNFLTRPGGWGVISASAQLFPVDWRGVARACLHPEEVADNPERRYELINLSRRLLQVARLCQPRPAALLKAALAVLGVLSATALAPGTPAATDTQQEGLLALLTSPGPKQGLAKR